MAVVKANISGGDDIGVMLDKLTVQPEVAKHALMEGAKILEPKLVAASPVRSGTLKGAIAIGKYTVKGNGSVSLTVGASHKTAPHAHLVERGHGGSRPAPAHPFMEPTYNAQEAAVAAAVMAVIEKELV